MSELREALEEAYEDTETEEAVAEEPEETKPEEPDDAEPEEAEPEETESEEEPSEEPAEQPDAEHAEEVVAAAPSSRAPASWRPGIREHWAKLPADVQDEVNRREAEITRTMQETAEMRKFSEEFNRTIDPFRPIIASQNSDPITATKNLMETAAGLTMGSSQQKAQIVSNIIRQYSVDINTLDQILSNQVSPELQQQSQVEQIIQQQMAPFQNFMNEVQQAKQQRETQLSNDSQSEIDAFSQDPANAYFEDVREDMADLLEMAAKRNKKMSLTEAYNAAVQMNPEISALVNQQSAAQQAQTTAEKVEKKKAAASSVKGAPVGTSQADDGSIRSALLNAFEERS